MVIVKYEGEKKTVLAYIKFISGMFLGRVENGHYKSFSIIDSLLGS
jgi:hypothetical protein